MNPGAVILDKEASPAPSDTVMNQGGIAAVEHPAPIAPIVMPSSSLSIGNPTTLVPKTSDRGQMDIYDITPITSTSPSTVTKIHERNDLPSLPASNLVTAEPTSDLNDDLRKQNETEMLVTGMATATNLKNLLLVSPFDERNRQLVQSLLEFFKLTVHSRFTSLLIDEHNSCEGFGQASKHSSEKVVKTGKTLKTLKNVKTVSSKPPIKPQDIIPFPKEIIPRLKLDPVMTLSLNVNDLFPLVKDDKWNAQYHDLSCAYNTLVISLMACKKFVNYLASTREIEKKPLHFVLFWIMKKIAFSEETYQITDSGFKEALDSQPHMDYYYSLVSKQRDFGEVLCHVQKVLAIESGIVDIADPADTVMSSGEDEKTAIENKLKIFTRSNQVRELFAFVQSNYRRCNICKISRKRLSVSTFFILTLPEDIHSSGVTCIFANGTKYYALSTLMDLSANLVAVEDVCSDCTEKKVKGTTSVEERMVSFPPILAVKVNRALQGDFIPSSSEKEMSIKRFDGGITPDPTLTFGDNRYRLMSSIVHDGEAGKDGGEGHFQAITLFQDQYSKFNDIGSTCTPGYEIDGESMLVDALGTVVFFYEKQETATGDAVMKERDEIAVKASAPSSSSSAAAPPPPPPPSSSSPQLSSSSIATTKARSGVVQQEQRKQDDSAICANMFHLGDQSQDEARFLYQNQQQSIPGSTVLTSSSSQQSLPGSTVLTSSLSPNGSSDFTVTSPALGLSINQTATTSLPAPVLPIADDNNAATSPPVSATQLQPLINAATLLTYNESQPVNSSTSTTTAPLSSTQSVSTVSTQGSMTTVLPSTSTTGLSIDTSHLLGTKRPNSAPLSSSNGGEDGKVIHNTRKQR